MSFIDRLNRHIANRLHGDAPRLMVESDAIRQVASDGTDRRLPFAALTEAIVLHRDVYAADAILIRLVFRDGMSVELFQDDPQWDTLTAALDASGRLAAPAARWQVQAIADGPSAAPRHLLVR